MVNSLNNFEKGKIAIIGAGNFTSATMLPKIKGSDIKYIVSKGGLSSKTLASKYGVAFASTNYNDVLKDQEVSLVAITTRHNLHASMVIKALKAGKSVFVEKPLALNEDELNQILEAQNKSGKSITVGFNRRFSPHIQKIKSIVPESSKKNMIATMNAGFIPGNVWVHDLETGGGRIIGEACHYIDLLVYLSGSQVKAICMNSLGINPEENTDNASMLLKFNNGDNGVINYFSNGSKSYAKERVEVFFDEKVMIMDNFRITKGYGVKGFSKLKTRQNKGHNEQFAKLSKLAKKGGEPLIPMNQIVNVTRASFAAIESLKTGSWVEVD
jgi:predicted dehydrogenase